MPCPSWSPRTARAALLQPNSREAALICCFRTAWLLRNRAPAPWPTYLKDPTEKKNKYFSLRPTQNKQPNIPNQEPDQTHFSIMFKMWQTIHERWKLLSAERRLKQAADCFCSNSSQTFVLDIKFHNIVFWPWTLFQHPSLMWSQDALNPSWTHMYRSLVTTASSSWPESGAAPHTPSQSSLLQRETHYSEREENRQWRKHQSNGFLISWSHLLNHSLNWSCEFPKLASGSRT